VPQLEAKNRRPQKRPLARWRRGLSLALCLMATSAAAQSPARELKNPPLMNPRPPKNATQENQEGREIYYAFNIEMTPGKIKNPATGMDDDVILRSYVQTATNQKPTNPNRFIAPTIEMKPGQTVRITLKNNLDYETKKEECTNHKNVPNCFNGTNLHAHGLWISPAGNSDNVLLEIKPKSEFQYEYNVPLDHPAGTYWYHPHLHGSTAMQVASGMAGALIIRGERDPVLSEKGELLRPGDIDKLLTPLKRDDPLEMLVFQQIPYACFDADKKISTDKATGRWTCAAGKTGEVSNFNDQLGFAKWAASGRYTSINGSIFDEIKMTARQVYRWRLVDAGIHEPIGLRITKLQDKTANAAELLKKKWTPTDEKNFITEQCEKGEVVSQFEVAADGLTHSQIIQRDRTVLQPGYRSDILFTFPTQGTYCLYDAATRTGTTSTDTPNQGPRLLTLVTVKDGQTFKEDPAKDPQAFIKARLLEAADEAFKGDKLMAVRKRVRADLENMKTTSFAPHKDFAADDLKEMDEESCMEKNTRVAPNQTKMLVKDSQCVTFFVGKDPYSSLSNPPTVFQINGRAFDSNAPPRTLPLGYKQKWVLTATAGDHPFHIHVNPFQIIKIMKLDDPNATTKTYTEIKDFDEEYKDKTKDDAYYDYVGMKGTWKDTIFVRNGYKLIIATEYRRYIGDFVFHCHLLDHEDQGMMESVRIAPVDAAGQPVLSSHAGH
jgi:L-ascorbate oxidase